MKVPTTFVKILNDRGKNAFSRHDLPWTFRIEVVIK